MYRRILLLYLICLGNLLALPAQGDFTIKDYQVDITLHKNGSFDVREIIKVHFFEARHGIKRDIPLKYNVSSDASGSFMDHFFPHEIFLKNIHVQNHPFKSSNLGIGVQIKIGDPDQYVEGDQLYDISYTVWNGLLKNNGRIEFYWNLVGDQWTSQIEEAHFRIEIPKGIPVDESNYEIRTGSYGSEEQAASAHWEGNILSGQALVTLGNQQGMTVAIRMPEGSVEFYPQYKLIIRQVKFLVLPILMIIAFLMAWYRYGRDTRLADVVAYLPPKDMDPAMAGFAIDIKPNIRDAVSLIPYFGARGYLKIEHEEKKGLFSHDKIEFIKLKDLPPSAPSHQKLFFDGLFRTGDRVSLSSLKDKFYTTLSATQSAISDSVMNSGYFTPISKKIYWNSIWIIIVLGVLNSIFCFFSGKFLFLGVTIVITLVLAVFAYILLKRSQQGDEQFKEIKGFRKFIEKAEKDMLNFLVKEDPTYFDKTLPYAVAFNCADQWSSKFSDLALPPPQWYHSNVPYINTMHGGFNPVQFTDTLSSSLSEMRSVMSSAPSSSGSSSSGGGSFSGGGFGGGGGSSW